jgi:hypothetical protein
VRDTVVSRGKGWGIIYEGLYEEICFGRIGTGKIGFGSSIAIFKLGIMHFYDHRDESDIT